MSIHYNAFISYRHAEVDSRVAMEIQRSLEHFHVPAAIRKKTGMNRIARIFRDKEELPITSDLNDDITEALANSDFLIVICSPRTGDSVWVQREIETFLRTHSRRQVLTVLAEGEPEDIIPEILRYDEHKDPATGEVRRVPVEPLSCDYRGSFRTARREELPRLAAVLLGCGYDELRQRQRQYRMRRTVAILSGCLALSLAFGAYFVRTSLIIRENYRQLTETHAQLEDSNARLEESYLQVEENLNESLRNQSEYLSAESVKALTSGDRLLAIRLALAALPGAGRDRPVIPQAELALTRALGAYQSDEEITGVGAFTMEGSVVDYLLDKAGDRLIAWDRVGQVVVWDAKTYQRLAVFRPEGSSSPKNVVLAQDRYLLLTYSYTVYCYDLTDNSLAWSFENSWFGGSILTEDEEHLVCVNSGEISFQVLDVTTGDLTQNIPLNGDLTEDEKYGLVFSFPTHPARQGGKVALSVYDFGEDKSYVPVVVDLERGVAREWGEAWAMIGSLAFLDDGSLVVMGRTEEAEQSSTNWGTYMSVSETPFAVGRISPEGEVLWRTESGYYQTAYEYRVVPCGEWGLACVAGNACLRLDAESGEIICRTETDTSVVSAYWEGSDSLTVVTRSGNMGFYYFEENECRLSGTYMDGLTRAKINHGGYVCNDSEGSRIFRYALTSDEQFRPFDGADVISGIDSNFVGQNTLAICSYDSQIFFYDLNEQRQTAVCDMSGLFERSPEYLGFTRDEKAFAVMDAGNGVLYLVHPDGSEQETVKLTCPKDYRWYGDCWLEGDVIYCVASKGSGMFWLCTYDISTGAERNLRMALPESGKSFGYLSHDAGHALMYWYTGGGYLVDLADGACTELEPELDTDSPVAWHPDGTMLACCDEASVVICGTDGVSRCTLDVIAEVVKAMHFTPDGSELLILDDQGVLRRYAPDGTYLGETDAYVGSYRMSDARWQFEDTRLILTAGNVTDWIDLESWSLCGYAIKALGWHPGTDTILSYQYQQGNYTLGVYPHYSVADLIAMGEEKTASFTLSALQKAQYGLD